MIDVKLTLAITPSLSLCIHGSTDPHSRRYALTLQSSEFVQLAFVPADSLELGFNDSVPCYQLWTRIGGHAIAAFDITADQANTVADACGIALPAPRIAA